jgi:hypothetical protein
MYVYICIYTYMRVYIYICLYIGGAKYKVENSVKNFCGFVTFRAKYLLKKGILETVFNLHQKN